MSAAPAPYLSRIWLVHRGDIRSPLDPANRPVVYPSAFNGDRRHHGGLMNKLIRHALPIVAIILYSGVAHALPNSTGTGCECYYDSDCPDPPDGKGVCWHGTGCTYNGDPFDPSTGKVLDGVCGFIGPGSSP